MKKQNTLIICLIATIILCTVCLFYFNNQIKTAKSDCEDLKSEIDNILTNNYYLENRIEDLESTIQDLESTIQEIDWRVSDLE